MENTIQTDEKLQNSSMAAFWATLLFIVLLVAALDFVHTNSGNHEEHQPAATEHQAPPVSETTSPAPPAQN